MDYKVTFNDCGAQTEKVVSKVWMIASSEMARFS